MRFHLVLCCFLAAFALAAQSAEKPANRWEISASFAPDLNPQVRLTGVLFEVDPNDFLISQRFSFDTIAINEQDRVFSRPFSGGIKAKPQDVSFWFGATVNLHRRIGEDLDFSAGLHYNSAGFTSQVTDARTQNAVVNNSNPFLYNLEAFQTSTVGVTTRINYHLFPTKRFHPYAGFGINIFRVRTERTFLGRSYSADDTFLPPPTSQETIQNSTLELSFMVTGGILYRITDQWSAGINVTSRLTEGPGLFGLELRRVL